MTVHRIRLLGDPILRVRCDPVEDPRSAAVRVVADDLQETLRDLKARFGFGRGLAAPQIGVPMRLIYIETEEPEMEEPTILVNPEIVDAGRSDFLVWDDCFSIPDLLVRVQRSWKIEVRYRDLTGKEHEVEAEGGFSELLQHEIDHLDGVLMVDRPVGIDPFSHREEWNKHHGGERRLGKKFPRDASGVTPSLPGRF